MRNLIISLIAVSNLMVPAWATTLEGSVQKNEVVRPLVAQVAVVQSSAQVLNGNVGWNTLQAQDTQAEEQASLEPQSTRVQLRHKPTGVVGVKINEDGTIDTIYHPSDLNRFGIVPGDRIVAVDGRQVEFASFQEDCRGQVGQIRQLTIVRDRQVCEINVALIDLNILVQYNHNFF